MYNNVLCKIRQHGIHFTHHCCEKQEVPHWISRFMVLLYYFFIFMKMQLFLTFSIFQDFKIISSSVAFNNGDTGGLYLSYVSREYDILSNQYYFCPYFISSGNMISSSISLSCQQKQTKPFLCDCVWVDICMLGFIAF